MDFYLNLNKTHDYLLKKHFFRNSYLLILFFFASFELEVE